MFSRIKTSVSGNPLVHVLIAAFIGGTLPVILPALDGKDLTLNVGKAAAYAGVAAVLRVVFLMFPAKQ